MPASSKSIVPLSRERIIATALALADEEGLDALSMRRLGVRLGVDPMAVYYYVPNKSALLDAVVEAVMAELDLGVDEPSDPAEQRLVRAATAYAEVLVRHSKTLPLLLTRGPAAPAALAPVELMVRILRDGGLTLENAIAGMNVVTAAVRGYAAIIASETSDSAQHHVEELVALASPEEFPHLSQAAAHPRTDPWRQFEFGVRAIAIGLLGAQSSRPSSGSTDTVRADPV